MVDNRNLDEIYFIRPILIVLLVIYHAFCTWTGAWKPFEGYEPNEVYRWIADFAYSFMLPMFVFQSGYVWSFQREVKGKKDNLKQLTIKKAKRLIIPSLLFSVLYLSLFGGARVYFIKSNMFEGCLSLVYDLLCGVGHMWFLPMLFWCFIISWLLLNIPSATVRYVIVLLLTVISIVPIPFGINAACGYLVYFLLGYDTCKCAEQLRTKITLNKTLPIWMLFVVIFVIANLLKDYLVVKQDGSSIYVKAIYLEISMWVTIVYSILGICAMYMTAICFTSKNQLSAKVVNLENLCFGVYLFQQFILIGIYDSTCLPVKLGLLLPWVSFVVTLLLSLSLSYIIRLSSFGRKII